MINFLMTIAFFAMLILFVLRLLSSAKQKKKIAEIMNKYQWHSNIVSDRAGFRDIDGSYGDGKNEEIAAIWKKWTKYDHEILKELRKLTYE